MYYVLSPQLCPKSEYTMHIPISWLQVKPPDWDLHKCCNYIHHPVTKIAKLLNLISSNVSSRTIVSKKNSTHNISLTSQPKCQSYNDHLIESKGQTCVRQFRGIHNTRCSLHVIKKKKKKKKKWTLVFSINCNY